jgi:hypothetical protein
MKSLFAVFLVLLAITTVAQTQTTPPARVFRIVSLESSEDALFYDNKTAATPLLFNVGSLSPEYPAPSKTKLLIYKLVPAPEGKPPLHVTVAELDYPADADKVIVLLYHGKTTPAGTLTGAAVVDDVAQHGSGRVRIINVSAMPAAFAADKSVVQAPPHTFDQYAPFPKGPIELQVAVQAGGAWTRIFSLERNLRPNTRLFAIVADAPPAREGAPPVAATIVYEGVAPEKKPL